MIELLAALSAAAAAGMRIALPLLVIGILQGDFRYNLPLLSNISSASAITILSIWSLFELLGSKQRFTRRWLQLIQLIFSPIMGAILALSVTQVTALTAWLFGLTGAMFAFVLQLVQAGWFYRWQTAPPLWFIFSQDVVCILLIYLAIKAPLIGGLIALTLLWLAIRSFKNLHRWYKQETRE